MNLFVQELPDRRAITETPAPGINQDKLIARGLQKEQYIGILGLAIALIAAVGFLSRRVEYAIVFAFVLSAILIALFLFI
ncbi:MULTISPECIES: hypothetical protein [unclassified Nostoc]|uniref:hypothetical protein n=1 Tax=unclassified Nostoc TaxID=2593658 RepID=UPI000CA1CA76|nr:MULTISPECIES: hypothetical protein [unclassified Nostoc]AUT04013.1 hypothetical protein CLI64_28555 [Nostoc sp. CENA543]MCF4967350.1 hypothetical protein [Nostoc sp. CMAA1605]